MAKHPHTGPRTGGRNGRVDKVTTYSADGRRFDSLSRTVLCAKRLVERNSPRSLKRCSNFRQIGASKNVFVAGSLPREKLPLSPPCQYLAVIFKHFSKYSSNVSRPLNCTSPIVEKFAQDYVDGRSE